MKEIYVLLEDSDGTMRSVCQPFGFAVDNEEAAKDFKLNGNFGYEQSYQKLTLCSTWQEAVELWKQKYADYGKAK